MLEEITKAMIKYDHGDPKRIHHFLKVHDFARLIGIKEGLDESTRFTLEIAAILHDIGIHKSEELYGDCSGKHQEELGPKEARIILKDFPLEDSVKNRVYYLIGHHHTYTNIDALDYQILVEADFLVNLYEDNEPKETIRTVREKIFKTKYGIELVNTIFDL